MMRLLDWFRRRAASGPLQGRPPAPRQKSYSASSGYVYQYFFEGWDQESFGRRYQYAVTADRKTYFPVRILIRKDAATQWERVHGRNLIEAEWRAVAKIALFDAFDRRPPKGMREEVQVAAEAFEEILARLGRD
jgi:hypothetical protein